MFLTRNLSIQLTWAAHALNYTQPDSKPRYPHMRDDESISRPDLNHQPSRDPNKLNETHKWISRPKQFPHLTLYKSDHTHTTYTHKQLVMHMQNTNSLAHFIHFYHTGSIAHFALMFLSHISTHTTYKWYAPHAKLMISVKMLRF